MEAKRLYHSETKMWVEQRSKDEHVFFVKKQRIDRYKTGNGVLTEKFSTESTQAITLFTGTICECESFINLKEKHQLKMK